MVPNLLVLVITFVLFLLFCSLPPVGVIQHQWGIMRPGGLCALLLCCVLAALAGHVSCDRPPGDSPRSSYDYFYFVR